MFGKILMLLLCVFLTLILVSCLKNSKSGVCKGKRRYTVKRASQAVELNGQWDGVRWEKTDILELTNYMGNKPEHFPKTQAKLLYDEENLYVFFRVEDRYVRCVADKTHGNICQDSCVEFFFTPKETGLEDKYFNLEINCGGTILLYYGSNDMPERIPLDIKDCKMIEVFHSLPKIVKPEITKPTTWILQYKVPLDVLSKYCPINKPQSGVKWRANFYKCADKTSHPHWLTWSFVDNPTPHFHLPQYFGTIEFE